MKKKEKAGRADFVAKEKNGGGVGGKSRKWWQIIIKRKLLKEENWTIEEGIENCIIGCEYMIRG